MSVGRPSRLNRVQRRTLDSVCDLYAAGSDDGRGGQTAPALDTERVACDVRPITGSEATEYLAERLVYQDPRLFIFSPDTTLPNDCYVLYDGTLYREEGRRTVGTFMGVMTVRADDQSTA